MINRFHKKNKHNTPSQKKKPQMLFEWKIQKKINSNMFLKAVFLPDESGGDPTFVNSFEFETLANFGDF